MTRAKSNGPYAPLGANYYLDDALLEAGEAAELLFVRCLAFNANSSSDGFITDRQMLQVVGIGLGGVPDRINSLTTVGLLESGDGGYVVRSWLKWNRSTAEIGKYLKRDRQRKAATRAQETLSARNPDGIHADSQNTRRVVRLPITALQSTKDLPDADASSEHDVFARFWDMYPRKTGKGKAAVKFRAALKIATADEIINGLKAQLDSKTFAKPDRGGTDYRPYPASWLYGQCWADEVAAVVDPGDQWARAYRNGPAQ